MCFNWTAVPFIMIIVQYQCRKSTYITESVAMMSDREPQSTTTERKPKKKPLKQRRQRPSSCTRSDTHLPHVRENKRKTTCTWSISRMPFGHFVRLFSPFRSFFERFCFHFVIFVFVVFCWYFGNSIHAHLENISFLFACFLL